MVKVSLNLTIRLEVTIGVKNIVELKLNCICARVPNAQTCVRSTQNQTAATKMAPRALTALALLLGLIGNFTVCDEFGLNSGVPLNCQDWCLAKTRVGMAGGQCVDWRYYVCNAGVSTGLCRGDENVRCCLYCDQECE